MPVEPIELTLEDVMKLEDDFSTTLGPPTSGISPFEFPKSVEPEELTLSTLLSMGRILPEDHALQSALDARLGFNMPPRKESQRRQPNAKRRVRTKKRKAVYSKHPR
jgi:hypothetical protein